MSDVTVIIGVGGMGETIARRQGNGRQLLLADFNQANLEGSEARLRGDGYKVTSQKVDVASESSVSALAEAAAGMGRITQVVHTAGLSPAQASVEAILGVDLAGVAFVLDSFGAIIAEGGAGVVIASMAGRMVASRLPVELENALRHTAGAQLLELSAIKQLTDPGAAYSIAKRANQLRVEAASKAWGARGARVNSVSPGIIATPMGQQELASDSGQGMRTMIEGAALQRVGTTGDIANAVAFLLSGDASFITGTDILVDGGVVASVLSRTS